MWPLKSHVTYPLPQSFSTGTCGRRPRKNRLTQFHLKNISKMDAKAVMPIITILKRNLITNYAK